ncbi:MAG TPA: sigma-70 family RNA polymerase sigma factor [Bacteroidales bacterium]|nr:sigma-70 family RNA polymerase sigma factor [Bacteroidales bacterium]
MKLIFTNNPSWNDMTDEALLALYRKSGPMEVIEELFNRYGHLVFGVCLKYLKDEDDAKDACLQIFEKLIDDLKRSEVVQFKAWIHTVTRNHCLIHIRKSIVLEKHREIFVKNYPEEFVNFWSEMNHIEEAELEMKQLYDALGTLDDDQRRCLDLIYLQGKSYSQIAEITGFDSNKVKSCIQNGKRNLKNILESKHGER